MCVIVRVCVCMSVRERSEQEASVFPQLLGAFLTSLRGTPGCTIITSLCQASACLAPSEDDTTPSWGMAEVTPTVQEQVKSLETAAWWLPQRSRLGSQYYL